MTAELVGRRAAIYARYSSDLQKDRSIDDQVALCREFSERSGYDVSAVYSDRALTSASLIGRDGIMQLIADAKGKAFDVVIVESLDRISRDQEDLAGVFKRLSFAGIEIIAVHDGVADAMQIGIRGLLGSLFLADLKHKVRRGMAGVVAEGRAAGGLSYGYDPVPGKPGERTINEQQAEVIRRIFSMYLEGKNPRYIAKTLNDEGILPPRGTTWNASTINGNKSRHYGILQNEMYNGKIIWNRVRMLRDPDTGRRVSRVNPQEEWKVAEVPHLAIVEPAVFAAAQEVKGKASKRHPKQNIRPKRVLSGLLRCRCCGGSLVSKGKADGVPRVRCAAYQDSGACDNNRSYRLDRIEAAVVGQLLSALDTPEASQQYLDTYLATKRKLIDEATKGAVAIEKKLARVAAEQENLITMVMTGVLPQNRVENRIRELEEQRQKFEEEASVARLQVPFIEIHPTTVRSYANSLARIRSDLEAGITISDPDLINSIRNVIHAVVVGNDDDGAGYSLDVVTYLDVFTGKAAFPGVFGGPMVAGEGLEPPTRGL